MTYTASRLAGAFGVEIVGIDLAKPLGDNLFNELHQTWLDHDGVMVVRDQVLTPRHQVDFGARFGALFEADSREHAVPGHPEIYQVSYDVGQAPTVREFVDTGSAWHSDYANEYEWAGASLLYVEAMPPKGGDICFADLYAAYEALSPIMQGYLATLEAVHSAAAFVRGHEERPPAVHPLVRKHPESGRTTLFVSPGFTTEIVGLTPAESHALLGFLAAHCTQPAFTCRHHWIPGDLVIWDNRCNLHNALGDYSGGGRVAFRRVSAHG